jgi:hypothetical protein
MVFRAISKHREFDEIFERPFQLTLKSLPGQLPASHISSVLKDNWQ